MMAFVMTQNLYQQLRFIGYVILVYQMMLTLDQENTLEMMLGMVLVLLLINT